MTSTPATSMRQLVVDLHRSLDAEHVPHSFGGGLALGYYVVHPRATDDIDLNVAVPREDALRVFRALPAGVRWGNRLVRMAEVRGAVKLRAFRGIAVDLFFPTSGHHDVLQSRSEVHPFADSRLPFVSATDLVVLKATSDRGSDLAGKERDRTDIRLMLEAGTPDVREALRWVEQLEGPGSDNLAKLRALVSEIEAPPSG